MTDDSSSQRFDPILGGILHALDGVDVWVDSGTLLALRRDQRLLSWDGDIDLSCWSNDIASLESRTDTLRALGYNVAVRRLAGVPYKLKLTPPMRRRRNGERHVDISIYTRVGEWALSPGIFRSRPSTPVWSLRHFPGHALREVALMTWLGTGARRNRDLRWPHTSLRLFTWCVPAHFFDDRSTFDVHGVAVPSPSDVDGYLTFRYGQWRTPQKSWSYFTDDRSVLDVRPEVTLSGASLPAGADEWVTR